MPSSPPRMFPYSYDQSEGGAGQDAEIGSAFQSHRANPLVCRDGDGAKRVRQYENLHGSQTLQ